MPQVMSGIGNIFTGGGSNGGTPPFMPSSSGGGGMLGKILNTGGLGMGFLSNWLNQRKTNSIYDSYNSMLKRAAGLTPELLAQQAAAATRPLSTGLTQNVGNSVQAMMAERGLGQAPGIMASTMAQALAPYQLENQKMGLDAALGAYGVGAQMNPAYGMMATGNTYKPIDLSGMLQKLQSLWRPSGQMGITDSTNVWGSNGNLQPPIPITGGNLPMDSLSGFFGGNG